MTSFAPPVRTESPGFQDVMAEQLRRTPHLALSCGAHALLALALLLLLPPPPQRTAQHAVAMLDQQTPFEAVPPPVVPPPPTTPVELPPEPTPTAVDDLPDTPAATDDPLAADAPANDTLAAFHPDRGNPTVGLSGGPTGHGGPHGRGSRRRRGGQPSDAAIDRGLEWLARHQDADGRWDCDGFMKHDPADAPTGGPGAAVHDVGVTGLALLALLGDGHTCRSGRYRQNVLAAVRWLREQQAPSGRFGPAASSDFIYDHAIAAYAMCEAYGLSQYSLLQPVAQRGLDYLATHRNPYGAFRYQPRDGDNDTSVTCWCLMALCSGRHWGLTVDGNGIRLAETFLQSCISADGHCGYTKAGEPGARKPGDHATRFPPDRSDALTAASLFCRQLLGHDPRQEPTMRAAVERLRQRRPDPDQRGSVDHYYWYYGAHALYQAGGPGFQEWSKAIDAAVVRTQRRDGPANGSWDPTDVWGDDGGRVYSTAILVLTLEARYRYSRLVR